MKSTVIVYVIKEKLLISTHYAKWQSQQIQNVKDATCPLDNMTGICEGVSNELLSKSNKFYYKSSRHKMFT